jgi:hypothetical protein
MSILATSYARAIALGQIDTFQDGTTMGWQEGSSPNPPINVATGGPAGAGDRYLENTSSGSFSAGGRMTMFNSAQWLGNYTAAGVNRISVQMVNFGPATLRMRIAFIGSGTSYGSNTAAVLPPDGLWRSVDFDLTETALTGFGGTASVSQALSNVTEFRIVSAVGGATRTGDPVEATLGIDNMTAATSSAAVPPPLITDFAFVDGSARVSFTTASGKTYRVERKDSLLDSEWIALSNASNVAGTGGVVQVSDPQPDVRSLGHRFYRVVLLD